MTRRPWTHRRLGIDVADLGEHALAETDALLGSVGARRTTTSATLTGADPVAAALLDFACDIDLVAGVAAVDVTPVASELLRLERPTTRSRRLSWRVLVPATSGGLAALAVAVALLVTGSSTPTSAPALSAATESNQLLSHADTLLSAAAAASPARRTRLVDEARADLTHVSRLLPLAPPPARPALRQQLHALNQRMRPLSGGAGTSRSGSSGSVAGDNTGDATKTSGSGQGSGGTTAPARGHRPRPPLAPQGDGSAAGTGSGTTPGGDTDGAADGTDTTTTGTTEPASPRPSGPGHPAPPPPPGASSNGTTQAGTTDPDSSQTGTTQTAPLRPRPRG